MKLSVSLSEAEVSLLDRFVKDGDLPSRSAGIQHAIRLLSDSELERDYADAFEEWAESGDAVAWERTAGDGVGDASR